MEHDNIRDALLRWGQPKRPPSLIGRIISLFRKSPEPPSLLQSCVKVGNEIVATELSSNTQRRHIDPLALAPAALVGVFGPLSETLTGAAKGDYESGKLLYTDGDYAGSLVKFSRWITPPEVRIRFDTHFFLAPAPAGQEPRVDGDECVDWGWFAPSAALDAATRDEIELVFPTIKHLEQLAGFTNAEAVLDYARGRDVHPVVPRVVTEGEVARIVLPDDPAAPPAGGSAG